MNVQRVLKLCLNNIETLIRIRVREVCIGTWPGSCGSPIVRRRNFSCAVRNKNSEHALASFR
jgi:hypothetical protein